ncbi:MAG: hypothetical protein HQK53_08130, partial [Oligoflexia bacterium]|nr:hypothetical protein [Oligoflexia bacterium]
MNSIANTGILCLPGRDSWTVNGYTNYNVINANKEPYYSLYDNGGERFFAMGTNVSSNSNNLINVVDDGTNVYQLHNATVKNTAYTSVST